MNMDEKYFKKFMETLKERVNSKEFMKKLKDVQNIDANHYIKRITINELNEIIDKQSNEIKTLDIKNVRIILDGNPEIVVQAMLEAIRLGFNLEISLHDFCFAQNTFLVNEINKICESLQIKIRITLTNMLRNSEIAKTLENFDKNVVVGDPNLYNRLAKLSNKITLNPYGIFEIYSDSREFEEVKDKIYDITEINQYFVEDYSDLDLKDAIKYINKDGYRFATIMFSKNEAKIQKFKEGIKSKFVIINENPFKNIKFEFDFEEE